MLSEISTFSLRTAHFLVFDEADRLFEMGVSKLIFSDAILMLLNLFLLTFVSSFLPVFLSVCRAAE
jgi:hypothetical protein